MRLFCLIFASVAIAARSQVELPQHEWYVTFTVVDEAGQPIAGATASVGYFSKSRPSSIDGQTDTNGVFKASHAAKSGILGFSAQKAGYYTTRERSYDLGFKYDPARWNPTPRLILRKIGNPIPMYAKKQELTISKDDEPLGFDLMAGDWVTPYGKGSHTDILFEVHRHINEREFDANLAIIFPNKGDGIVAMPAEAAANSEFVTSRAAAESGYGSALDLQYSNTNINVNGVKLESRHIWAEGVALPHTAQAQSRVFGAIIT
jgi:hypothetical protein